MSQNRTFVPGMENSSASSNDFMYSRTTAPLGTIVPGMAPQASGQTAPLVESKTSLNEEQQTRSLTGGMPVIGFLYSISNQGIPEYWPIVLGYNRIGRNPENEVCLNEQTVSGLHASIMVQKKRNGEVVAVIRMEQGRTGIFVNDEEIDLRYGSECKNGDVIQVGNSYSFLFILINAEAVGLRVADNFIPAEMIVTEGPKEDLITKLSHLPRPNMMDRGTISLDGSSSMETPGGTRFM